MKTVQISLNSIDKVKSFVNDITKFDYDEAKKTHYYHIFKACELKEQLAHWEEVLKKHTLNPALKAKAGAKGLGKTETFTSAKIASIKSSLQKEINKIDAEIAKFNNETELEITDDDDLTSFIAA
jgi:hypothetical protein